MLCGQRSGNRGQQPLDGCGMAVGTLLCLTHPAAASHRPRSSHRSPQKPTCACTYIAIGQHTHACACRLTHGEWFEKMARKSFESVDLDVDGGCRRRKLACHHIYSAE